MKGTRPLDNNEIRLVSACFCGKYEVRNRGLFLLGVSTGGRISELLSTENGYKKPYIPINLGSISLWKPKGIFA